MLLNVREQTTALTVLCYEFFGGVSLFQESMSEALSFQVIFIMLFMKQNKRSSPRMYM